MKKQITILLACSICTLFLVVACTRNQSDLPRPSGDLTAEQTAARSSNLTSVPKIIIDSACKQKRYKFYLDPGTHSFFETLYFHFLDPVTGAVVAIRKNTSLVNPRLVIPPAGASDWKVVAATDSLVSLTYSGPCSYSAVVAEDPDSLPSVSNLVCNISKCGGAIGTEQ